MTLSPNLVALLYLVVRRPVHPGAARAFIAGNLAARQHLRHDRHGHRDRDNSWRRETRGKPQLGHDRRGHRHWRRHRRLYRAQDCHDGDAAACRRVPQPCRPCRGLRGGRRLERARSVRHRPARRNLYAKLDRDVDRRRHRRGHILGLAYRVREAERQHVGQADPAARSPYHQPWPRDRPYCPHRAFRPGWKPGSGTGLGPDALLVDCGGLIHLRHPAHRSYRRRRHAGRGVDAELLFGLGCRRYRLHPFEYGADHYRRACRFLRRHPVLHHV